MVELSAERYDAVIFDMDGVITDTASTHMAAWKKLFDDELRRRAGAGGAPFEEFTEEDYRRYVDGKPRYDGVRDFLASRGIELPWGDPGDAPGIETVCALGNRKNDVFQAEIEDNGANVYATTVDLLDDLAIAGVNVAVISASKNAELVLGRAGVLDRFDARVDGVVAAREGLPGKPDPAVFLEAARRVGAKPDRSVVVEDAIAGVEAGQRGGFGLVIGVDRTGHPDDLSAGGADVVVSDLAEVDVSGSKKRPIGEVPAAKDHEDELAERLRGREPAVFLDYDGTLTPIVDDPKAATIDDDVREVIRGLSRQCTVAVISGRDLDDVRGMVGIDDIYYAGSHGFDILAPDGTSTQPAKDFLPSLDRAEQELQPHLEQIPGARIERKRFAIAVHFRQVEANRADDVESAVNTVVAEHNDLRITGGKMIYELRPKLDWDKGKALLNLVQTLGLDRDDVVPMYLGDDVTDEDAFKVLVGGGLALVVQGEDDSRPTLADYTMEDPAAAVQFLDDLRRQLETRNGS